MTQEQRKDWKKKKESLREELSLQVISYIYQKDELPTYLGRFLNRVIDEVLNESEYKEKDLKWQWEKVFNRVFNYLGREVKQELIDKLKDNPRCKFSEKTLKRMDVEELKNLEKLLQ